MKQLAKLSFCVLRLVIVCNFSGDAPLISAGPEDQSVFSGSKVILDCVSKGDPTPFVLWTSGVARRPVYQEKGVTVGTNGSLMFDTVGMSHNGTYTCWAVSSEGASQSQASLTVTPKKGTSRNGEKYQPITIQLVQLSVRIFA